MTKKELEKEATEYAEKHYMTSYFAQADIYVNDKKEIINAILYFAEPREKRITDLEAQIEKMKCCGNCGNERCTSKYRGNSAYHRQAEGYACADNEDWIMRSK